MPTPHCRVHDTSAAFVRAIRGWLATAPVENNAIAAAAAERTGQRSADHDEDIWISIDVDGAVVGAAARIAPKGLLVSQLPDHSVVPLVKTLAPIVPELPGAGGPRPAIDLVASEWARATGVTATPVTYTSIFRIDRVEPRTDVPGFAREATTRDHELLSAWFDHFTTEARSSQPSATSDMLAELNRGDVAAAHQWLWEVNGNAVAMVTESVSTGGVIRLRGNYTPPNERGRGYASALLSQVSSDVIDRPDTIACVVYADQGNSSGTSLYLRVGYRKIRDLVNYEFTSGNAE